MGDRCTYSKVVQPVGVLDSGAEGTTIPRKIARKHQYPVNSDNSEKTMYIYGNNQRLESIGTVKIGEYVIDVMPEPVETPLISVAQIVDHGYSVLFRTENVSIVDSKGDEVAKYKRGKNLSWKVPLNLLSKLTRHKDDSKKAYSGRLHTAAGTPRERVMELHGRMAHASEDTMCMAIFGDNPAWKNTGVTTDEIKRVFNKEPCIHCVMCKRRKDGTDRWKDKNKIRTDGMMWMDNSGTNQCEIKYEGKAATVPDREWNTGECLTVDNVMDTDTSSYSRISNQGRYLPT